MGEKIIYKELSFIINGLLFEVHNELGRYWNEKQCGDLFEQKLKDNNIKYQSEVVLPKSFIGEKAGRNRIDFIFDDKIIVELKCERIMIKEFYYQLRRYLKAHNKKLGILVNFRDKYLKPRRVVNSEYIEV